MLKEFSKYIFANILIKAVSFLTPLILAYYYTQAEYGIISLGYAYLLFFSMFFAFGSCESVSRFYYELRDTNQNDIFGNILLFDFILVLFFSLIFVSLCFCTSIFKEIPKSIFVMVLFVGYMKALQNIGLVFLQMEKRSSAYVTVSVFSIIFDVLLIILFVAIIHLSVEFRFVSLVICNLITSIFVMWLIRGYIGKPITAFSQKVVEILKFAFPCMLLPIMSWLLTTSDKIVMSKLGTMSNVGVYSFCFSLAQLPAIIFQGFNTAYTPIFYSEYQNKDKIKSIQTLFIEFYVIILLLFVLFMNVFFKYIKIFEKYETGLIYIPLFVLANFFSALSSMNNSHLAYSYKTKIILIITSITGALTIFLNYLFIKKYNSMGAAISVAVSMGIQLMLSFLFSIKYGYFAWKGIHLALVIIIFAFALVLSNHIIFFSLCIIFMILSVLVLERKFVIGLFKNAKKNFK